MGTHRSLFEIVLALVGAMLLPGPAQADDARIRVGRGGLLAVPPGETSMRVPLSWTTGGSNLKAWLWMQVDDEPDQLVADSPKGSRELTLFGGKTYTFRIYTRSKKSVLASASVMPRLSLPTPPKPPRKGSPGLPPPSPDPDEPPMKGGSPESSGGGSGRVILGPKRPKGDVIRQVGGKTRFETKPVGEVARRTIYDVEVSPDTDSFKLSFKADPGKTPLLQVSRSVTSQTLNGEWTFASGAQIDTWKVRGGNPAAGEYFFDFRQEHLPSTNPNAPRSLDVTPGTRYYFIISVPRDGGGEFQYSGSFTTWINTVRITFEKITVRNDSDDGGNGELSFFFGVEGMSLSRAVGSRRKPLDWSSRAEPYSIHEELVVSNPPDKLTLYVEGADDDRSIADGFGVPIGVAGTPLKGPVNTGDWEMNVAIHTFELRRIRGVVGFHLKSMPATGGDQGDLEFDVQGRMEIIRGTASGAPKTRTLPIETTGPAVKVNPNAKAPDRAPATRVNPNTKAPSGGVKIYRPVK
jgi:hypothetical protein